MGLQRHCMHHHHQGKHRRCEEASDLEVDVTAQVLAKELQNLVFLHDVTLDVSSKLRMVSLECITQQVLRRKRCNPCATATIPKGERAAFRLRSSCGHDFRPGLPQSESCLTGGLCGWSGLLTGPSGFEESTRIPIRSRKPIRC